VERHWLFRRILAAMLACGFFAVALAALSPSFDLTTITIQILAVTALASVFTHALRQQIGRPLDLIERGAERFARGDLTQRLPLVHTGVLGTLGRSLNVMARQLDDRMRLISRQRNELDVVLAGMAEGVISIDLRESILTVNPAAAQLLGCDPSAVVGRSLQEIVRNLELLRFMKDALASLQPLERRILFHSIEDRWLDAYARILRATDQRPIGVLIVINDVTRLCRLESLRKDFVANVSHELKTPVTSIKGFVETLLDGAIENPDDARRFLGIMARQADRLNAIFDDLLSLSKLEQSDDETSIELKLGRVAEVLQAAIQTCEHNTRARGVTVRLICPSDLSARFNSALLEQAVVNLVDNATKYSEAGKSVDVSASSQGDCIQIMVRDNGPGIDPVHLTRIFERFYRIDAGRSRRQGGTGLGLAIVKHIAQAHSGSVAVESQLGAGSSFYIRLPQPLSTKKSSTEAA